jgi:hypothetical protein
VALPSRGAIAKRLEDALGTLVAGRFGPVPDPPDEIKQYLDDLLTKRKYTVRDGMLTLLAMEVEHGNLIDWRTQGLYNPARAASHDLGSLIYPRLNIVGSREALNSGVKGVGRYIDRNNKTWKAILDWASVRRADPDTIVSLVAAHYGASEAEVRNGSEPSEPWFVADVAGAFPSSGGLQPGVPYKIHWRTDSETAHRTAKKLQRNAEDQLGIEPIRKAFEYLAAGVAATARNVPRMPSLDTPKLTFPAVFAVLDEMLGKSSAGAHEQFTFAALLAAWREQLGEPGLVETKNLNASDASAGTAADVQEKHRGQVTEAYELTAAAWHTKVDQAAATLRRHDLPRVHIVARDAARAHGADIAAVVPPGLDVTVRDVREEVRSLVARLSKPHRRQALERLYDLLVSKQPNDALVQGYVSGLEAGGLTET